MRARCGDGWEDDVVDVKVWVDREMMEAVLDS